jgi:hypothetical protein
MFFWKFLFKLPHKLCKVFGLRDSNFPSNAIMHSYVSQQAEIAQVFDLSKGKVISSEPIVWLSFPKIA